MPGIRSIGIDLETTHRTGCILSAGVVWVDPDGTTGSCFVLFPRPRFPSDSKGPIVKIIPGTKTAAFRHDHGTIVDWGDFQKNTFINFWVPNMNSLIRNTYWDTDVFTTTDCVAMLYSFIYRSAKEAIDKGLSACVVSDNSQFDVGTLNTLLIKMSRKYLVCNGEVSRSKSNWKKLPPPTLDFLPLVKTNDDTYRSVYCPIRDISSIMSLIRARILPPIHVSGVTRDHCADNDARYIAAFYATFALMYPDAAYFYIPKV